MLVFVESISGAFSTRIASGKTFFVFEYSFKLLPAGVLPHSRVCCDVNVFRWYFSVFFRRFQAIWSCGIPLNSRFLRIIPRNCASFFRFQEMLDAVPLMPCYAWPAERLEADYWPASFWISAFPVFFDVPGTSDGGIWSRAWGNNFLMFWTSNIYSGNCYPQFRPFETRCFVLKNVC